MAITVPPDNRVAGDIGHLADHTDIADGLTASLGLAPSGDTTGATDYAAMQAQINASGYLKLQQGVFYVNHYLLVQKNDVHIVGSGGANASGYGASSDLGTTIRPTSTFSTTLITSGPTQNAVIMALDTTPGTGGEIYGFRVKDLWIDGSSAPANIDGISLFGPVKNVHFSKVGVYAATGRAFAAYSDPGFSGLNDPGGIQLDHCLAQSCTGNGFHGPFIDGNMYGCHAQSCSGDGFHLTGGNCRLTNCRSDLNTNGFYIDTSGAGSFWDGVTLVNCGTQINNDHGIRVTNGSASGASQRNPVNISGCFISEDGAAGGNFAAILIEGMNHVNISGTVITAGTFAPAGAVSPKYGIWIKTIGTTPGAPAVVSIANTLINYSTVAGAAAIQNDAPAALLNIGGGVASAPGYQPTSWTRIPTNQVDAASPLYAAPSGALGETMGRLRASVASQVITTSGTIYLTAIVLPAGLTISNISMITGTVVKTGGTHGWYVLCDSNLVVRDATADQTDAATKWGVASTEYKLATTARYVTTYTGLYYVGIMVANSGGTQPSLLAAVSGATGIGLTPKLSGISSVGQTTPPATDGSVTLTAITNDASRSYYAYVS